MPKSKASEPRRKEGRGYVYIMSYAPGIYKVGWTVDVHARRLMLQSENSRAKVRYIKHWEFGDYSALCVEGMAHNLLSDFHTDRFGGYEVYKVSIEVIEAAIFLASKIIEKTKDLDLTRGLAVIDEKTEAKTIPTYIRGDKEYPFYE